MTKSTTKNSTKLIPLTQGKFAIIDSVDHELVSQYKWYYRKSGKTNGKNGYAQHSLYIPRIKNQPKRHKSLFMHNLILVPRNGLVVDHINRNGLDNRRANLRLVTKRQNYANFPPRNNNSGYRGVCFHKRLINTRPYQAQIRVDNKVIYLGTYTTAKEAARVYNENAIKYFGEAAHLNKL